MFLGVEDEAAWRKANERPFHPGMRLRNAAPIACQLRLPDANNSVTEMLDALVANAVAAVRSSPSISRAGVARWDLDGAAELME
jgi:hypothetical protein